MLIDTHCHLDFKDFDNDRDQVIDRARNAGLGVILNVGSSVDGSKRSVELAKKYDFIYASVGIHPHDVKNAGKEAMKEIADMASYEKVVAIGEVGLDYYRDLSPRDAQRKTFCEFIALAKKLKLPLIIHNRDSHNDMLDILKSEFGPGELKGVMHCFSGDEKFLEECLKLGLFISFTCNITYKNAGNLRSVAGKVPIENTLLETDAPFLAPQSYRGKRNEPAYLKFLVDELSAIHGLSAVDVMRVTSHNANGLFGFGVKEATRVAYEIRDSLYLNITNRCTNECCFCIRTFSDFVKGHRLKLDAEPTTAEILDAVKNVDKYKEIVFCGYGEPTLRLDVVKAVAAELKKRSKRVRLVTNGHGDLINNRNIAPELKGLIDMVSVSLNADTGEQYDRLCKPQFGRDSFEAVKRFVRECRHEGIEAEVSCLDLPGTDIEKCSQIAREELGAAFRLRRHNIVG